MSKDIIGKNLRSGVTPGGFTRGLGDGKRHPGRPRAGSSIEVRQAAQAALDKRGLNHGRQPCEFRDVKFGKAKFE